MWDLGSPGAKPRPPEVEAQSPNHCTTGGVLSVLLILVHLGDAVWCNLYSLMVNEVEGIFIYLLAIWM